jgi:hypothetical protein
LTTAAKVTGGVEIMLAVSKVLLVVDELTVVGTVEAGGVPVSCWRLAIGAPPSSVEIGSISQKNWEIPMNSCDGYPLWSL